MPLLVEVTFSLELKRKRAVKVDFCEHDLGFNCDARHQCLYHNADRVRWSSNLNDPGAWASFNTCNHTPHARRDQSSSSLQCTVLADSEPEWKKRRERFGKKPRLSLPARLFPLWPPAPSRTQASLSVCEGEGFVFKILSFGLLLPWFPGPPAWPSPRGLPTTIHLCRVFPSGTSTGPHRSLLSVESLEAATESSGTFNDSALLRHATTSASLPSQYLSRLQNLWTWLQNLQAPSTTLPCFVMLQPLPASPVVLKFQSRQYRWNPKARSSRSSTLSCTFSCSVCFLLRCTPPLKRMLHSERQFHAQLLVAAAVSMLPPHTSAEQGLSLSSQIVPYPHFFFLLLSHSHVAPIVLWLLLLHERCLRI